MLKHVKQLNADNFRSFALAQRDALGHQLRILNKSLNADYLFIAVLDSDPAFASTVVCLEGGTLTDNFTYPLKGSPCESVFTSTTCTINKGVCDAFPDDCLLKKMRVEGYIGAPIYIDNECTVGILVAMFREVGQNYQQFEGLVNLSAEFIGTNIKSEWHAQQVMAHERLLNEIGALADIGAWEYDVLLDSMYWSDEVYNIYGLPIGGEVTPSIGISYFDEPDRQRITALFESALTGGLDYMADFRFKDAYSQYKWVRTNGKSVKDETGKVVKIFGAIEDVTVEKQLLESQQSQMEYLRGVLDNLNDAVISINGKGEIIDANKTAENMFGYSEHELKGQKIIILMPEPYSSQHHLYMKNYKDTGQAKIMGIGRQLPAQRKNGDIFQMELSLSEYTFKAETHYIGIVRDISERIKANDTIYNMAYTDPITGLKNRAWFEKEVRDLLARAAMKDHYIYCSLVDIDRLSQYNLAYGIYQGNQLISLIADRLKGISGTNFQVYKFASNSFVVVSFSTKPIAELAEFEREAFERSLLDPSQYVLKLKDDDLSLSVSVGSIISPAKLYNYESLVDALEFALVSAKINKPFGQYFLGDSELSQYERTNKLRKALKKIVENDELHIVLQPQYETATHFSSSEALVRWTSKEFGFVSPAEFIPLAEESDVIVRIGDWVLEQVCQLLSRLQQENIKTRIAVNISGKQIVQPDFSRKLHKLVRKWKIAPSALMLELTETTLVSDISLVKKVMLELNEAGFSFSIDDFGTGYSSLSYIKELPISELKIDKYFIDGIGQDGMLAEANIINVIIDMGRVLNVTTVAEGVETIEQYDYLKKRGCHLIQGYLFSKPLDVNYWTVKLKEQMRNNAATLLDSPGN